MKQEIRARIDQIRQGIVPDGYTKTRSEITPTTWTPACLGDIYTERKEPGNESLPLLTVSIHSGVSDGELDEDELPKKVKRIEDKSQYKRAATGDLVFNMMRAWQGAIGTVRTEGMVSPAYIVAKPNDKVYPPFMDYYMKAPRMVGMINRQSYGVTDFRKRLYWDSFAPIPCVLPPVREQKKIAEILSTQDKAIELQARKIEELKRFKKGCLEKMFPRKGQKVPEKRFPGFTDDWEQRKVGDLLIERNQQAPMSDEYPLMAFIANEGVAPKGERYDRSALVTDTVNKLYKKTEKGDFIYSSNNLETGSIGLNKYGKACISPVYSIFEPTGIADSDFLGRRLVRKDFINAMVKWRQGVIYGQWRIHESDFLKIEITVPSVEEQRKIGAYLDQLDNLITLHQRKLEEMKRRKKALMQLLLTGIAKTKGEVR